MGSICQCPEGVYEDLDLRMSQNRNKNYRSSNNNYDEGDEESTLIRKAKNNNTINFSNKSLKHSNLVIDKEVSLNINNSKYYVNYDNKSNKDYNTNLDVEKININEQSARPSEYHSRTNSWVSKLFLILKLIIT